MLATIWFSPMRPLQTCRFGPEGELMQEAGLQAIAAVIGPPGPAGAAGGEGAPLVHQQSVAAIEWTINHNKGFRPMVEVLSPGGTSVMAEISHISDNQVRILFNTPQQGQALVR